MSIFSIPPPSFTKSDAKKIGYDVYGLIVKARTLDSDRDQNFYLYNKEKEFVLKIYNPKESIDIINMQTNVLHHFQENQCYLYPKEISFLHKDLKMILKS